MLLNLIADKRRAFDSGYIIQVLVHISDLLFFLEILTKPKSCMIRNGLQLFFNRPNRPKKFEYPPKLFQT